MTDHELAVFEIWIWFVLVFSTIMLAAWFWRRITTKSDAIAEANDAKAEADQLIAEAQAVLDENETIESYLEEWSGTTVKTAIAETRALDQDRA